MIMFALMNLAFVSMLFIAMLAMQEVGRRLGERTTEAGGEKRTTSGTEAAVYGILGLFLAFTFSVAGARFEERRHLAVAEANAIGTAWLRIDILPVSAQPHLRDLFRQYVDARLERAPLAMNPVAVASAVTKYQALQQEIWSAGVAAAKASGQVPPFSVFLPALNEMIDITATRETVARMRTPLAVSLMVASLSLIGSLFAGYDLAGKARYWFHTVGFALVLAMTLFVIIDLEFPRLGFIRVDASDLAIYDVRRAMQ
jgi:membrane-associated protease RseP (regulator of RpoE activity)